MYKGPRKIVRDDKSSSYPVFELTGVNCNFCKFKIKNMVKYLRIFNVLESFGYYFLFIKGLNILSSSNITLERSLDLHKTNDL